jgi:protein-L-isoaspartate(D-aspartate) O-methyltransferase
MAIGSQSEVDPIHAARVAYARQVCAAAGLAPGSAIESALAAIPREQYVGPTPWRIVAPRGRARMTTSDPAALYQDVLISLGGSPALNPSLNNGQPSLHAMCLAALGIANGDHVIHVGAGTGYYTAILAMLVGESGRVDAYEIEPDLAERASANLAVFPQVEVHARSGVAPPLSACDVIYVNAAAAEPMPLWLDALRPNGRLLFPLAGRDGTGEMLLLTRRSQIEFAARFLSLIQFVPCIGAQNELASRALRAAFRRGGTAQVRRLIRNREPDSTCWLAGNGWWLGR